MINSIGSVVTKSSKILLKTFKWLGLLLLMAIAIGLMTEFTLHQVDRANIEMPGKLVNVNDKNMHLWCTGTGDTMLLLDAGATMFSTSWRYVANELNQDYEVCAFDRAGLGWSDRQPEPYDGNAAIQQLQQLLNNADKNKPFVYIGHSLGAMFGRMYAHRYPDQIKALIMVEPADPDIFLGDIEAARGKPVVENAPIKTCGFYCPLASAVSHVGLTRLLMFSNETLNDPLYHPLSLLEYKTLTNTSKSLSFFLQRGRYMPDIMFQTKAADTLFDIPMVIYYGQHSGELLGNYASEEELKAGQKAMIDAWQQHLQLTEGATEIQEIPDANHLTIVAWETPAKTMAGHIKAFLQQAQ